MVNLSNFLDLGDAGLVDYSKLYEDSLIDTLFNEDSNPIYHVWNESHVTYSSWVMGKWFIDEKVYIQKIYSLNNTNILL